MRFVETTENPTGTRYLIAWSYRKLNSEQEFKNIMQGNSFSDISDIIEFEDPISKEVSVAFQLRGQGPFKVGFSETFRYTVSKDIFQNNIIFESEPEMPSTPWYRRFLPF